MGFGQLIVIKQSYWCVNVTRLWAPHMAFNLCAFITYQRGLRVCHVLPELSLIMPKQPLTFCYLRLRRGSPSLADHKWAIYSDPLVYRVMNVRACQNSNLEAC